MTFHHSEDTKRKMSEAKKKNPIRYWKGKKLPEETRKKLSAALKGRTSWTKGKKLSEEYKRKISEACKGRTSPNKNKTLSEEHKRRLSQSHKGQKAWNKGKPGIAGEEHPNWKGGTSYYPYCWKFNERLKEQIRERDNRTCQLCRRTEKENLRLWKEKLCMHHVHYDKPNCKPDLISLCKECSSVVNFNRDYYENLFMQKLKDRGLA